MIIRRETVPPFDFEGLSIRDYTADLGASSSFAVITVPAGTEHAEAYSKRSDKYYFVVAGVVEFTESGETHELSSGDFCMVRQGERFSYRNETDTTAALVLFHTPSFELESEVIVDE